MVLTTLEAAVFAILVLPLCLYVAWSDMARMKIPTWSTDALLAIFVIAGLFVVPTWSGYGWRLAHFPVMLIVGIVLNAGGIMGAGDAKFIASAAPFVPLGDLGVIFPLAAACVLAGFATHRLIRATPLRARVAHWASWEQENRRFPFGLPLAGLLGFYLILGLIYGA